MTPFERYRALLSGEAVDHLPRVPILMAFAAHFIGADYRAFASYFRVLARANLACAEHFGFEQLSAISDPYRETHGFGAEIIYPDDQVPHCVAPPLAKNPDLALLKQPDPYRSERMLDRLEGVAAMRADGGDRYSVMGWIEGPAAEAADLRGISNFLVDLMTDEAYAGALMDRCVDTAIAFAKAQIEKGADTIGMGDAIASQVSPDTYATHIFAREKKIVDAIHAAGGWVRLHICGDTTHLLPWFAQLGCDIIDLDWQVDLVKAREILGPKQVIVANLDPVKEVMDSTPARIQQRLTELYRSAGGPMMAGAGCEIPPGTPHDNLLALCTPVPY